MKIIKLFLPLLLFIPIRCYSQSVESNIHIEIKDTAMLMFMDSVENKLLGHIEKMQKGKANCDINMYEFAPDEAYKSSHWTVPLTINQTKENIAPKERLKTNKYELSIDWNNKIDTGHIIGFSRMYYHYFQVWQRTPYTHIVSFGPWCYPIYNIPLVQYGLFLDKREMKKLQAIIRQSFVEYVTDYDYPNKYYMYEQYNPLANYEPYSCFPCNDSTSLRIINVAQGDSVLPQFSLSHWCDVLKGQNRYGELPAFKEPFNEIALTHREVNNIYEKLDSVKDTEGNPLVIAAVCQIKSVTVAEKWKFNENIDNRFGGNLTFFIVSKKFVAFGLNANYYDDFHGMEKSNGTAWIEAKYIDWWTETNMGKLALYKEMLDAPLYKKLGIGYR